MKCADIIVYAVSKGSATNKNVKWELKKACKLNKYIVCLKMEPNLKLENECLFRIDENTKQRVPKADILETEAQLFKIIDEFIEDSHIPLSAYRLYSADRYFA